MNILYICCEYPPGKSGGIGSATRNLAREMVKNGHKVFVAGLYMPGYGQKDFEETDGIKIWRKRLSIDNRLIGNNYSGFDNITWHFLRSSGILSRSFKKGVQNFISFLQELVMTHKIDIIEWPDFNECFDYSHSGILPTTLPIPIIVKLHGSNSYIRQQTGQPFDERIYTSEKGFIHSADAIIAVSRHTAQQNASFYHIHKAIQVLYNGVTSNPAVLYSPPGKAVILFTGSLSKLKGVDSLLQAWNTVHEKYPGAVLQLFGKGRPEKFTHLLDKKAKASVRFMGFVKAVTINKALQQATAAIFPSYMECFSIVPLEAMANGCPVIFTERASGPELIENGVNGLLVNPDNPAGIADAISLLITDQQLCRLFSDNGRQTIEKKFNIIDLAEAHLTFYQTIIDKYNRENT